MLWASCWAPCSSTRLVPLPESSPSLPAGCGTCRGISCLPAADEPPCAPWCCLRAGDLGWVGALGQVPTWPRAPLCFLRTGKIPKGKVSCPGKCPACCSVLYPLRFSRETRPPDHSNKGFDDPYGSLPNSLSCPQEKGRAPGDPVVALPHEHTFYQIPGSLNPAALPPACLVHLPHTRGEEGCSESRAPEGHRLDPKPGAPCLSSHGAWITSWLRELCSFPCPHAFSK